MEGASLDCPRFRAADCVLGSGWLEVACVGQGQGQREQEGSQDPGHGSTNWASLALSLFPNSSPILPLSSSLAKFGLSVSKLYLGSDPAPDLSSVQAPITPTSLHSFRGFCLLSWFPNSQLTQLPGGR